MSDSRDARSHASFDTNMSGHNSKTHWRTSYKKREYFKRLYRDLIKQNIIDDLTKKLNSEVKSLNNLHKNDCVSKRNLEEFLVFSGRRTISRTDF